MGTHNLILTKADLTDKPYEVQLGVLRWMKQLVSGVVDTAVASGETEAWSSCDKTAPSAAVLPYHDDALRGQTATAEAPHHDLVPGDCCKDDSPADESSQAVAYHHTGDGCENADDKIASAESNQCDVELDSQHDDFQNDIADGEWKVEAPSKLLVVDGKGDSKSRKRPRMKSPLERDKHVVGSVVECFHVDDGLWYPATVTAAITVRTEEVVDYTTTPAGTCETPQQRTTNVPKTTLKGGSHVSDHSMPMSPEGKEESSFTSESTTQGGTSSPPTARGCEEEESNSTKPTKSGSMFYDVIFMGYGNTARVPVDWVKEVSSPEVLQWCVDRGVAREDETNALTPTLDMNGDISLTDVLIAGGGKEKSAGHNVDLKANSGETKGKSTGIKRVGQKKPAKGGNNNDHGVKKNKNKNKNKSRNKNNNTRARVGNSQGIRGGNSMVLDEKLVMQWGTRSRSPYPHVPDKYWGQRYRYFSRFDEGVIMDEEGWYSVTPEAIARHIAERVCCDVVVDPFVGCGGNAVQFALVCHLVIAVDLDPIKLEYCRRNAAIYGVEDRIEFILGDAMKILPTLKADAVFLSPPWGGPTYERSKTFDLSSMIPAPLTALEIFRAARAVTPNVVFFLPRNVDAEQVASLPAAVASCSKGGIGEGGTSTHAIADNTCAAGEMCELEQQFLNGKLKTTTAYYGEDIVALGDRPWHPSADAKNQDEENQTIPAHDAIGGSSAAWNGQHVRFDDDEDILPCGGETVGTVRNGHRSKLQSVLASGKPGSGGRQSLVEGGARSLSQERENMLYEAWVAAALQ